MTEPTHEEYVKLLVIVSRMTRANRELAGHLRNMTLVMEEQQDLIEAAQAQIDHMNMRLAVLEAAREKGH